MIALDAAADVQHDRIAGLDLSVAGVVVRGGRVGAAGHDREVGRVVAFLNEALPDLPRDVTLRSPDQAPGENGRHRPIGRVGGLPQ